MSTVAGFDVLWPPLAAPETLVPEVTLGAELVAGLMTGFATGLGVGLASDFGGDFAAVLAGTAEAVFLTEALGMVILLVAPQTDRSISSAVRANAPTMPAYPIHCLRAENRKAAISHE
jgi:predicted lipid-binding transport protein (Tim44 family)